MLTMMYPFNVICTSPFYIANYECYLRLLSPPAAHSLLSGFLCVLLHLWLMNTITLISGVNCVLTVKTDVNGAWGDSSLH